MIIAIRWRRDKFAHVLFIGTEPCAEVMRNVGGKPGARVKINVGRGLVHGKALDVESGERQAERYVDDEVRAQLTDAARQALEAAGL